MVLVHYSAESTNIGNVTLMENAGLHIKHILYS